MAHFDWFLSIFQISDVKPELLPVKLKVRKNGIFWAKNLFQKNFPRLFLSPKKSYVKKLGQNATRDAFQMLPQVGLKELANNFAMFSSKKAFLIRVKPIRGAYLFVVGTYRVKCSINKKNNQIFHFNM